MTWLASHERSTTMINADYRPISPELDDVDVDPRSIHAFQHGFPCPLVRWHRHDDIELHLIVEGEGTMFVGDHVGSFAPKQLVMLGAQLPHNWVSRTAPGEVVATRDYVVQFRRELVPSLAVSAPELSSLLPLLERSQCGVEFFGSVCDKAHRLVGTHDRERSGRPYRAVDRVPWPAQTRNALPDALDGTDRIAGQRPGRREGHCRSSIYIASQSRARSSSARQWRNSVVMGEAAFSRFFTRVTGDSFNRYLNRVRIASACERLSATEEPVTSICYAVGFNNVANFNRRFREYKSMTPREYRRQVKTAHRSDPQE